MSADIRQSEKYSQFLKKLGWQTEKIGKTFVFIRKFPLIGSLVKVQRVVLPIPFSQIEKIAKKHRAFKTIIEFSNCRIANYEELEKHGYCINNSPFLPTKTIIIDLKKPEEEIFNSFSPEKRRAIRKAEKNGLVVKIVDNPLPFINLKQKSLLEKLIVPVGSKKEIISLWESFAPEQAKILIVHFKVKPVAGIFMLLHEKMAYYWLAASTNKGKKLFAPSLLVWEALKTAKKLGCTEFDFEGIYDERFPISSWKGFTKFKQGFGGKEVLFPKPVDKKNNIVLIFA